MTDAGSPVEAHPNNSSDVSALISDNHATAALISFRGYGSDPIYHGQAHLAHNSPGQQNQNFPAYSTLRGTGYHVRRDNTTPDNTNSRGAASRASRIQATLAHTSRLRYRSEEDEESLYDSYQGQNSAARPLSLNASYHARQRHQPLSYSASADHHQQEDGKSFVRPLSQQSLPHPTSQASNHDIGQNQHLAPYSTSPSQVPQQGQESPTSIHHANLSSEHLRRSASVHSRSSHSPGWANSRTAEWAHRTNEYYPNPYSNQYQGQYPDQYLGQHGGQYPSHPNPYPSHYQGFNSYSQASGHAIGYQGHYYPVSSGPIDAHNRQFPLAGHPTGTEAQQHTASGNATETNDLQHSVPSRLSGTGGYRDPASDTATGNQDPQDPPADLPSATEDRPTGTEDAKSSE
jgi:hypothetical protein